MSNLDAEVADEAYNAFISHDAELDEWDAEPLPDAGHDVHPLRNAQRELVCAESRDVDMGKASSGIIAGDSDTVRLFNRHMTRAEAKELVQSSYDAFDDVVGSDGVDLARLAEYSSRIPFFYHGIKGGDDKVGWLTKYPMFLDLLGVSSVNDIDVGTVLHVFRPDEYEAAMADERMADALARSGAELVSKHCLDMHAGLDADDYELLRRNGVDEPERFKTVGDVCGFSAGMFDEEPDDSVKYNADYMADMKIAAGETAVI